MAAVAEGRGEEAGKEVLVFHYTCTPIDEELILIQNLWFSRTEGTLTGNSRGGNYNLGSGACFQLHEATFDCDHWNFHWNNLWCISQVCLHSRKVKLRLVCALVCATHTALLRIANQNLHVYGIVLAQTQLLVIPGRFAGKLISFTQHLATWRVCQLTWHMHKQFLLETWGGCPHLKLPVGTMTGW